MCIYVLTGVCGAEGWCIRSEGPQPHFTSHPSPSTTHHAAAPKTFHAIDFFLQGEDETVVATEIFSCKRARERTKGLVDLGTGGEMLARGRDSRAELQRGVGVFPSRRQEQLCPPASHPEQAGWVRCSKRANLPTSRSL